MLIRSTVLSLVLLSIAVQADSSRREPSLFLEYERELKKMNDFSKDDDTSFNQSPSTFSKTKASSQPDSAVKSIAMAETTVLKNTKIDPDTIGKETNPFLVVPKPAPIAAATLCDVSKPTEAPKSTPQKIIKNLKTAKEKLLSRAKDFLGTPYGFGDKDSGRTDCSGFTQQVYQQFGISLPHSAMEQAQLGENVNPDDLQIGDLLFYRTYKSDPSHVAIYAGNGQIIHASYTAHKVQYDSIEKEYYKNRFMYARRIALNDPDHDE